MVMQNSVLDPQDQRKTSSMEDSTAMTIEFLRARLLSERSVSRSARQRADELAEKVMELEEQLRVVTLQRKMAEKATVDVLSILENQGISDAFEESDFGSDLEIPCDSGVSNDSASAKGSERPNVDSSGAAGKSLSWKGRLDSSRSLEKYKTSNVRRRSSFSSISSSPKHCLGKSCRRLKHRETRSVVEEPRDKPVNVNCQGNEAGSFSEGFPTGSNGGPYILRREFTIQDQDESALGLANKNHDVDGERENNMERALEHQAQLIDQYEAMEKDQREWEEKFRDNISSTPESNDLGNHSDITEERDENKAQIPWSAMVVTSSAQEDGSQPRGVCLSEEMLKPKLIDNMPKSFDDTGYNNQNGKSVSTSSLLVQENSHSLLKGNQKESQENCHCQPTDQHHHGPRRHDFPNSKPTDSFPTDVYSGSPLKDAGRNNNGELVSHEKSREVDSVLELLTKAKLSLQQEINKSLVEREYTGKAITTSALVSKNEDKFDIPGVSKNEINKSSLVERGYTGKEITTSALVSKNEDKFDIPGVSKNEINKSSLVERGYTGKEITTSALVSKNEDKFDIPGVRCSSLFRLPTDFSDEETATFNFRGRFPTSGFSPNVYPGRAISGTSGVQFDTTNLYSGTMLSSSAENQSFAARYPETGSRFDTERVPPVPFLDGALFSAGKYLNPTTLPISSSHQNATPPPMAFGEGLSRPYSSSTVGVPPAYQFSFHGDH